MATSSSTVTMTLCVIALSPSVSILLCSRFSSCSVVPAPTSRVSTFTRLPPRTFAIISAVYAAPASSSCALAYPSFPDLAPQGRDAPARCHPGRIHCWSCADHQRRLVHLVHHPVRQHWQGRGALILMLVSLSFDARTVLGLQDLDVWLDCLRPRVPLWPPFHLQQRRRCQRSHFRCPRRLRVPEEARHLSSCGRRFSWFDSAADFIC